jgi:hypothetical protein
MFSGFSGYDACPGFRWQPVRPGRSLLAILGRHLFHLLGLTASGRPAVPRDALPSRR